MSTMHTVLRILNDTNSKFIRIRNIMHWDMVQTRKSAPSIMYAYTAFEYKKHIYPLIIIIRATKLANINVSIIFMEPPFLCPNNHY